MNEFVRAAQNGLNDAVATAIESGIDINGFSNSSHHETSPPTALMVASGFGRTATVELLLSHGANINLASAGGHTALHWACHNDEISVIELLLREGADLNIKDNKGKEPVDLIRNEDVRKRIEELCCPPLK